VSHPSDLTVQVRANHGTPLQRAVARHITRWYCRTRLPHAQHHMRVIINFSDTLKHYGTATWNGAASNTASSYTITIRSNLGVRRLMAETMMHELVHVEQMVRRDLLYIMDDNAYKTFWKGVRSDHVAYMKQPWEREAYAREHGLASEYLAEHPLPRVKK
jgi:hypothetical protein